MLSEMIINSYINYPLINCGKINKTEIYIEVLALVF